MSSLSYMPLALSGLPPPSLGPSISMDREESVRKLDKSTESRWGVWGDIDPFQVSFDAVYENRSQSDTPKVPRNPAESTRSRWRGILSCFSRQLRVNTHEDATPARPADPIKTDQKVEPAQPAGDHFPETLPSERSITFYDSSYFTAPQQPSRSPVRLPTPSEVITQAELHEPAQKHLVGPRALICKSLGLVIKYGRRGQVKISEGQCLWALRRPSVQQSISRLIPEVYGWAEEGDISFIYMQYIDGVSMESQLSHKTLDEESMLSLGKQLESFMKALQALKPYPDERFIGDIARGPPMDVWWTDFPAPGAFSTVTEFHDWFAGQHIPGGGHPLHPSRNQLDDTVAVRFTHNDLHPRNILISRPSQGPPQILAIIDWHQSGWYPQFWEDCKFRDLWRYRGEKEWDDRWAPGMLESSKAYGEAWCDMVNRLGCP